MSEFDGPNGGPVEREVLSAHYPAGPGWWHGSDGQWHPPPEPAEPPGTAHQVGDTKLTWQGTARWDGAQWVLAPGGLDPLPQGPRESCAHTATSSNFDVSDIYNRRLRVNHAAMVMVLFFAICLSFSRGLPVVTTSESCNSQLFSVQMVFVCGTNLDGSYTSSYSVYNVTTTYDPWPGFTYSALAPNGKSILFYFAVLFSILWSYTVRRRARELPTFWRKRAKRQRMRVEAGLIGALIATALTVNLLQVSQFGQQWTSQTCGHAGWCSASPAWGLPVLVLVAVGLALAIGICAWSLESDKPSAGEMSAVPGSLS